MSSDYDCLTTIVFDSQAISEQAPLMEHFVQPQLARLVGLAEHQIRRYHVVDLVFGAEDAVKNALVELWRALSDGKIGSPKTESDLTKLLRHMLKHEVLSEREREDALKRGGAGARHNMRVSAARHLDADFDAVDARAHSADEALIADEAFERTMAILDLHDAHLRAVATGKANGFTHSEIAAQLGISLSTVERRIHQLKEILEAHAPVRD